MNQKKIPSLARRNTRLSFALLALPIALALPAILVSCREAGCPDGEVAVEQRCYPAEWVAAASGQVPIDCGASCGADAPFCDYRTGTCFACRSDDDCTDRDAPVCDPGTRACVGCSENDHCADFDEVCRVSDAQCVECTLDTESYQCRGNTCHLEQGRCTNTPLRSVEACGSCVADNDCGPNMRCVDYTWRAGAPTERVCLYDQSQGGCQNELGNRAPYVSVVTATTVGGETIQACAPPSTCFATLAYLSSKSCVSDADCRIGHQAAGMCDVPAGAMTGRCMMACRTVVGSNHYPHEPCRGTDACGPLYCMR